MKRGTPVFLARVTEAGEVEVVEARVEGPGPQMTYLDRAIGPDGRSRVFPTHLLHGTRSAALHALAEHLERWAKQDRLMAEVSSAAAEQRLLLAEKAKRLAGGEA